MASEIARASIFTKMGIDRILVKSPRWKYFDSDFDFIGYDERGPEKDTRLIELHAYNMMELRKGHVEFDEDLDTIYSRLFATTLKEPLVVRIKKKLFEFQLQGVGFLHAKRGRALLADEMGLGKTVQVIALLATKPKNYTPTLVLCPAHVKLNWYDELGVFWENKRVEVIFGTKVYKIPKGKDIIVINQHLLKTWTPALLEFGFKYMVIDEGQSFVSKSTKTYSFAEQLARKIGRVTILTGTPLVNKADDLWGLTNLISPYIFGGYTRFINRFCPAKRFDHKMVKRYKNKNDWGRPAPRQAPPEDSATEKDQKLLHRILVRTCMLRRLKDIVAPQLPKRCRKVIRIKIESSKFWKAEVELRKQIKLALKEKGIKDGVIDMRSYSRMRQIVGEAKFDSICDWIDLFLESNDKKLVVTGWHVDLLKKFHEKYPDSYLVTGKIDTRKKHAISKEFATSKGKRILFGNFKSIGTGINLTVADTMVNIELPFTGADLEQVEARIHRLSQRAKHVLYMYFVVAGSLEEQVLQYISEKQQLASKILDNQTAETLEDIISDDVPNSKLLKRLLLD